MLLDVGRIAEALDLETRLAAVADASPDSSNGIANPNASSNGAQFDKVEDAIARQTALLQQLELDCIALGGSDVGCGLVCGPGKYSAHVRACRDDAVKAFLSNIPQSCNNCGAAPIKVRSKLAAPLR